jgi:GrpB-like predicted nucleotidyltransferase (UPF0157 family)
LESRTISPQELFQAIGEQYIETRLLRQALRQSQAAQEELLKLNRELNETIRKDYGEPA